MASGELLTEEPNGQRPCHKVTAAHRTFNSAYEAEQEEDVTRDGMERINVGCVLTLDHVEAAWFDVGKVK